MAHIDTKVYYTQNATLKYIGDNYGFLHDKGLWRNAITVAEGLDVPGSAKAATRSKEDGLCEFEAGAQDRVAWGCHQIGHEWKVGTPVMAYARLLPDRNADPGTGSLNKISFGMKYVSYYDDGSEEQDTWTQLPVSSAVLHPFGPNGRPVVSVIPLGEVDLAEWRWSTFINWLLTRNNSDNVNDTYPGTVRLLGVGLLHRVDKFGSREEDGDE